MYHIIYRTQFVQSRVQLRGTRRFVGAVRFIVMPSRQICQHPPTPSICVHVSSHLSGKTGIQEASAQARLLEVELLRDHHGYYFQHGSLKDRG
jgi:hypothetical protein